MRDPQASGLLEVAVEKLKDYADTFRVRNYQGLTSLPIVQTHLLQDDPREASNAVADAWKQSKKIREGRALTQLDENMISKPSNSNEGPKNQIPIQVQVWSQTQGKMDNPASEIRCGMCCPATGEPALRLYFIHSGSQAISGG